MHVPQRRERASGGQAAGVVWKLRRLALHSQAAGRGLPKGPASMCACSYVCGYMNRYRNTIRFLTEAGCEVLVVTPGKVGDVGGR